MKTFNIAGRHPILLSDDEVRGVVEDLQCYLDSIVPIEPSIHTMRVKFLEEEGYMGTDDECVKHYKDSHGRS